MPLIHRTVGPVSLSKGKLELKGKYECEFVAVNNETLVNVLRQLASLVSHASDIFSATQTLTEQVGKRIRTVKLRIDELEAKTELFDPKLVPVPEGSLDDVSNGDKFSRKVVLEARLFSRVSRPRFLAELFSKAGSHCPAFPPRSPITTLERTRRNSLLETKRPASFAALRDWKLDDYLDEKIATLSKKKPSAEELNKALALPFPSQLVQVDVTGQGFDRMKRNRRSLVIHTKRIRRSKRRNTICGSMPNKECGIQTSFSSVNSPQEEDHQGKGVIGKKYGIDSGHWSSCTSSGQGGNGAHSTTSAPSPWDPTSLSTSSDFLFDDEDRCLTPQLEHFTDGLVSDTDSVDTEGFFTSFRSDCGFPKSKKSVAENGEETLKEEDETEGATNKEANSSLTESEYELFGKGSTSTTASSCGTVVFRNKPSPPQRAIATNGETTWTGKTDDAEWEERVKRKSLIERVPSLVVVTPSPSCSSESPPPLKDPSLSSGLDTEDSDRDSGRITPKAEDFSGTNGSECWTLSDTDSEMRSELRPESASSTGSGNSTMTLTSATGDLKKKKTLPQPDVIPDVQMIRTKGAPKLDVSMEYCSLFTLDTVLLNSSSLEERRSTAVKTNTNGFTGKVNGIANGISSPATSPTSSSGERVQSPSGSATSSKIRGARVVLDANGEIIFASETLRRKRKPKVSFDPGSAVKTMDYDSMNTTYGRVRESVYDRIVKKDGSGTGDEKLYDCIEEIRRQNMMQPHPYLHLQEEKSIAEIHAERMKKFGEERAKKSPEKNEENGSVRCSSSASSTCSTTSSLANRYATRPPMSPPEDADKEGAKVNLLLETDLDSAIPPSMPDLKNLPKIKDRLKRNESYRIANNEEEKANANTNGDTNGKSSPRPGLLSLSPTLLKISMNNKLNRRMSFASNTKEALPNGNLHLNKKRDILEEDPLFIQQILSLSSGRNSPAPSMNGSTPNGNNNYGSRVTLSKLSLSQDDRPTFLRRESPPTMDDIAKEIYRFRKKFNIQPNARSRNLLPSPTPPLLEQRNVNVNTSTPQSPTGSMKLDANGNNLTRSPPGSTIPLGFPKLEVQYASPLSSSTPRANTNSNFARRSISTLFTRPLSSQSNYSSSSYNGNYNSMGYNRNGYQDPINLNRSQCQYVSTNCNPSIPPPPPIRNLSSCSNGRKIFPAAPGAFNASNNFGNNNNNLRNPNHQEEPLSWGSSLLARYRRNSMSLAEPSPGRLNLGTARTSLTDFKKLLQQAKPKRTSISAMEALKPKVGVETTL